ncbi:ABC transporter ATP-binding protein [Kineosporia babensis]|uniref:ABC transporter ATP-binding protein n=1 Tax=Kineosporia babensis TaxID=499548 RepID=A0A9X1NN40_9ACTN|nr:ABC transporter ATP-binding protein [Kineosporia babensis]MCD5316176.1 ABC transporter ATP-binding protein [Kineosporia babensis]
MSDLEVQGISVELAGRRIINQITLTASTDIVGLVGPNGSGKSTLLRTIYRMLRPTKGHILAEGRDVWGMRSREAARVIAAVVQDSPSDLELTVTECVATGRVPHGRLLGAGTSDDQAAVERAMNAAGVTHFADRGISTLSGGERQRVQLARALAQEPSILVLDEPTNHLDIQHQLSLLALVRSLRITTLITLHDLNLAAAYCDRVVVLFEGSAVATGTPQDVLTPDLLQQVFGVKAATMTNPLTGRLHLVYTDGNQQ